MARAISRAEGDLGEGGATVRLAGLAGLAGLGGSDDMGDDDARDGRLGGDDRRG